MLESLLELSRVLKAIKVSIVNYLSGLENFTDTKDFCSFEEKYFQVPEIIHKSLCVLWCNFRNERRNMIQFDAKKWIFNPFDFSYLSQCLMCAFVVTEKKEKYAIPPEFNCAIHEG